MYIVITDSQIYVSRNLKLLNKKINGHLDKSDFKQIGNKKIIKLSNDNLDYIKDLNKIKSIPFSKLYKTENIKAYLIVMLILQFILMVKK